MALPNIIQQINSKLPLTGGTVTGVITCTSPRAIEGSDNNNYLVIAASPIDAYKNSSIFLHNINATSNAGCFQFRASDGTNTKLLHGSPTGTLTWCGDDVITSAGGTMKGILNIPINGIRGNKIDGCIHIYAGTDYSNGAILRLCGNSETNSGEFSLWAGGNGSGSKQLHGYPNGTLTWAGSKVLTEADKTLITQWGLPNYSAIITGLAMTYTAPHNGVVLFNKDVGNDSGNVTVNGVTVYLGGNDASNEGNVTLFLKKGDTINMSPASAVGSKCFIPLYHGG